MLFVGCWIAGLLALTSFWFPRDASSAETAVATAGMLVFVFVTSFQSLQTSAKLGRLRISWASPSWLQLEFACTRDGRLF